MPDEPAATRARAQRAAARFALACAAVLVAAVDGRAGEAPFRFELTPYSGYRFGGAFEAEANAADHDFDSGNARGLLFDLRTAGGNTQWEVLYARQRTKLETRAEFEAGPLLAIETEYLQAGGTYLFDGHAGEPFVALTAGVSRFTPGPEDFTDEDYISASLGGGVRLRPRKRVGVRLEGRVFASLVDSDGELFCRGGAGSGAAGYACALAIEGETLVQWEVSAGLVFRF